MLENNDSRTIDILKADPSSGEEASQNMLQDVLNYFSGKQSVESGVAMAGLVPALPMYGDPQFDKPAPAAAPKPETKAEAEQEKAYEEPPKHKYEPPKIYGDPGIIARPDEWLKIENFTNPFNPIFH